MVGDENVIERLSLLEKKRVIFFNSSQSLRNILLLLSYKRNTNISWIFSWVTADDVLQDGNRVLEVRSNGKTNKHKAES